MKMTTKSISSGAARHLHRKSSTTRLTSLESTSVLLSFINLIHYVNLYFESCSEEILHIDFHLNDPQRRNSSKVNASHNDSEDDELDEETDQVLNAFDGEEVELLERERRSLVGAEESGDVKKRPKRNSKLRNLTRKKGSFYPPDASFSQRHFLRILMFVTVTSALFMLYICYCCCCNKGWCPCCKCLTDSALNKFMLGAEVDSKGKIHYRELNDEEKEAIAEIKAEYQDG